MADWTYRLRRRWVLLVLGTLVRLRDALWRLAQALPEEPRGG